MSIKVDSPSIIYLIRKIKSILSRSKTGARVSLKIQKIIFNHMFKNEEDLFTYYYNTNKWGNAESLSGPGSTFAATEKIRLILPLLIEELQISSFLDAPCGDYYWFKMIPIPKEMKYIGGDIVKKTIEINTQQYSGENISFRHIDITNDVLPDADLWLCRDALFHLSNNQILKVITNLKKSKMKYFLSTTFTEVDINKDIMTGDFRPINLEIPPFNFPPPMKYIDDSCEFQNKKLGLWNMEKLENLKCI